MFLSYAFGATPRILSRTIRQFSSSSSKRFLIVNALGEDRPGIVADVTKQVVDAGGNIGESRAVKLGGHFSMMMLVSISSDKSEVLEKKFDTLEGLHLSTFETNDPNAVEVKPQVAHKGTFTLSGADDPGIVHKISSVLAQNGMSIDTLETSEEGAPHGGATLFLMEGLVTINTPTAKDFDLEKVQNELGELGESMNCDVNLEMSTS